MKEFKTRSRNAFARLIRAQLARETRASTKRDRVSRERVHPIQYDVNMVVNFITTNRTSYPGALDAARRTLRIVDPANLRFLISVVRDGYCSPAMKKRCERMEGYCETLEKALALMKEWKSLVN